MEKAVEDAKAAMREAFDKAAVCICPSADKGHAYGKITMGCPVHAQPVEVMFNLPGGGEI